MTDELASIEDDDSRCPCCGRDEREEDLYDFTVIVRCGFCNFSWEYEAETIGDSP